MRLGNSLSIYELLVLIADCLVGALAPHAYDVKLVAKSDESIIMKIGDKVVQISIQEVP